MLQVRKKTAIKPFARRIQEMSDAGVSLSWDRYEAQLPLCGFTQSGLNCSACFQGPCRINPFGDEPNRGICGVNGGQIVLHNLFSHVRRGTLDHLNVWWNELPDERSRDAVLQAEVTSSLAARLPEPVLARLRARGLLPRNLVVDVLTARNPFLIDPAAIERSLASICRMGVCSLLASAALVELSATRSHVAFDEDPWPGVTVLIDGTVPRAFADTLQKHASEDGNVRVTGTSGNGFLHGRGLAFLSPGSPELSVASAEVDFVLQSDLDGYPALVEVCEELGVPRVTIFDDAPWPDAADILQRARDHRRLAGPPPATGDGLVVQADEFPPEAGAWIREAVAEKAVCGVVLLVAGTNVRQTHHERTIKVASGLLKHDVVLLLAGDAAAIGTSVEEMAEAAGPGLRKVLRRQPHPWLSVGSVYESARALQVIAQLVGPTGLAGAPVAASFLEIPSAAFLASAFGWLGLGVPTQLGSPLPLWGDRELTRRITEEGTASWGAPLLASPKLLSPEEQVQQLLDRLGPRD